MTSRGARIIRALATRARGRRSHWVRTRTHSRVPWAALTGSLLDGCAERRALAKRSAHPLGNEQTNPARAARSEVLYPRSLLLGCSPATQNRRRSDLAQRVLVRSPPLLPPPLRRVLVSWGVLDIGREQHFRAARMSTFRRGVGFDQGSRQCASSHSCISPFRRSSSFRAVGVG